MRKALSIGRVVVVYLLLGFVATWAVAWGLAAFIPIGTQFKRETIVTGFNPDHRHLIAGTTWRGIGSSAIHYRSNVGQPTARRSQDVPLIVDMYDPMLNPSELLGFETQVTFDVTHGKGWGKRHIASAEGPRSPWTSGLDDARGLPFLAVWSSRQVDPSADFMSSMSFRSLAGGIELPLRDSGLPISARNLRALPYYPIWSGLALNTAFYALLFFAVIRVSQAFKHAGRYRRGLCPRCKYDLRFDYSRGCSECGRGTQRVLTTSPECQ